MPENRKQETFKSLKFKWCHLSLVVIKWFFLETDLKIYLRILRSESSLFEHALSGIFWRLIWVYTFCLGPTFQIRRVSTDTWSNLIKPPPSTPFNLFYVITSEAEAGLKKGLQVLHVDSNVSYTLSRNAHRLTFTTLWANSADDKLMIFFLFFTRKQSLTVHRKLSRDNLHEVWNPVSGKIRKF